MKIKVTAEVSQGIEVDVDIDDVIESINNLNIAKRWNYVAMLLNGITVEDRHELTAEQSRIISGYLKTQADKF